MKIKTMGKKEETKIIAYKGFDSQLRCRGFQYEVGKEYELPEGQTPRVCNVGFHACPNPADLFAYYAPNEGNRYCIVELSGEIDDSESDKLCASRIKIVKEITPTELANAHRDYVMSHLKEDEKSENTGNYSSASNTGDRSSASNTGYYSSASNTEQHGLLLIRKQHGRSVIRKQHGRSVIRKQHGRSVIRKQHGQSVIRRSIRKGFLCRSIWQGLQGKRINRLRLVPHGTWRMEWKDVPDTQCLSRHRRWQRCKG